MSILDTHWTDEQATRFLQSCVDSLALQAGRREPFNVQVSSFFLNPERLGASSEPSVESYQALLQGIQRVFVENMPDEETAAFYSAKPFSEFEKFLSLTCFSITRDRECRFLIVRPNDAKTLAGRLQERTGLSSELLSVDARESVCGFDNFELIDRMVELSLSFVRGGYQVLDKEGLFGALQYESMIVARGLFFDLGGDERTVRLHKGAAHIGAFTTGHLAMSYFGFLSDIFSEEPIRYVREAVFNSMAKGGFASTAELEQMPGVKVFTINGPEALVKGIYQEFAEQSMALMTHPEHRRKFAQFQEAIDSGNIPKAFLEDLNRDLGTALTNFQRYLVLGTCQGLNDVMGEGNIGKYTPYRPIYSHQGSLLDALTSKPR